MKYLSPTIKQQFFDDNGDPLVGGKVYTYTAGSTTPKASYSDESGTPNTNPVVLDAAGRCNLWLSSGYYKVVLKDADDVEIWTQDRVSSTSGGSSETQPVSNVLSSGWYAPAGSGATQDEEFGYKVWKMPNPADVEGIKLKRRVKVPESYAGGDIEFRFGAYTPSYSTSPTSNQPTFKFQLIAALIRKPTDLDEIGYEVDDDSLSETETVQISAIPATTILDPGPVVVDGLPNVHRVVAMVIADSGEIDGQTVVAGDFLDLELTRVAITPDASLYTEDTESTRIIDDYMEVIFS